MKIKISALLFAIFVLFTMNVPAVYARHGHDDGYHRKDRRYSKVVRHHHDHGCHGTSWEDRYEHKVHRRRDDWRIGIILPVPIVIKIY